MSFIKKAKGRLSNFHIQGSKPDIFIFSAPRSGSTFLMELLGSQPGAKVHNEPLSIRNKVVRKELGVTDWEALTTMTNREEVYKRYFDRLRTNEVPELNSPLYWRTGRFITWRNVFKILYGGEDMIPWFEHEFVANIVLLVRHPIATTLSHESFPRLPFFLKQEGLRSLLTRDQIEFAERILMEGDEFERGILNWCLQYFPALTKHLDPKWALISYEELTVFPEDVIKYLEESVDLKPFRHLEKLISRPSESTTQSDEQTRAFFSGRLPMEDRHFLIKKWKSSIAPSQEQRAFEILDAFEIDYYEPNFLLPAARYRISDKVEQI